jgi:hypothetical protein
LLCLHRKLDGEERRDESGWFRAIVVKSPSKRKVDEMKRAKEIETIDAWLRDVRDNKINERRYKRFDSRRRSHIETRMRYFKSRLKVRPVFLESEMRIRELAFVTNLALIVHYLL